MDKRERRAQRPASTGIRQVSFRLRANSSEPELPNDGWSLDGYGAVFNSVSVIDSWEGVFREQIAPGSMKKTFRENPPIVQFDHGHHPMIGSIPIADLKFAREDVDPEFAPDGGAHIGARIFQRPLFEPLRDALEAQAIKGMSFRFEVVREMWQYPDGSKVKNDEDLVVELRKSWDGTLSDDEMLIRTLQELRVPEVGPVVWPAYTDTSVSVRNKVIDLGRLHEPGQQKLLARAMWIADSAAAKSQKRDDDADDDPKQLTAALDAVLDQASDLIADVDLTELPEDVAQACGLIVAAESIVDNLMDVLNIYDPDDDDDDESSDDDEEKPRSKDVDMKAMSRKDAPQITGRRTADKHASKDAPQTTSRVDAGEHPSQSTRKTAMRNQVLYNMSQLAKAKSPEGTR